MREVSAVGVKNHTPQSSNDCGTIRVCHKNPRFLHFPSHFSPLFVLGKKMDPTDRANGEEIA